MWNIFRPGRQDRSSWRATMGWLVLTYQEGHAWLSLPIEPMHDSACQVHLPGRWAWRWLAPAWARDRRETIVSRLRGMAWNRDLAWHTSDAAEFWPRTVFDPQPGSLPATPGGQELERMWLFQPEVPNGWTRPNAKRAWLAATEQMCLSTSGPVTLRRSALVKGSVVQKVVLPALRSNPRVRLTVVPHVDVASA